MILNENSNIRQSIDTFEPKLVVPPCSTPEGCSRALKLRTQVGGIISLWLQIWNAWTLRGERRHPPFNGFSPLWDHESWLIYYAHLIHFPMLLWTDDHRKGFFPGWEIAQNCMYKSIDWFVFLFPPSMLCGLTWRRRVQLQFRENFQCQYLIIPFVFQVSCWRKALIEFQIPTHYKWKLQNIQKSQKLFENYSKCRIWIFNLGIFHQFLSY